VGYSSAERFPPRRGREPGGEGGDEVAELVRPLDEERPVERREHRRHPVEALRAQLDAELRFAAGISAIRGRQFLNVRDAGGEPSADLLGRRLDQQGYLMPIGSRG
jgi:hypothetical protein